MNHRDQLRRELREKRKQLSTASQKEAAEKLTRIFIAHPFFTESQHIAGYYPVQGEISPLLILEHAWTLKKQCYLPVLDPTTRHLNFVHYARDTRLTLHASGIPGPDKTGKTIALEKLDLVIVPLIAFDPAGHRLGSGKGYYDATFQFLLGKPRTKPCLVGIGYTFQQVATVVPHAGDVPLDMVVTEVGVVR